MTYLKFICSLLVSISVAPCFARLQPDEIAILAVRGSRGSEKLAAYYAKARGIPEENICTLVMPRGETLKREQWTWAIRPEIQKWIIEHDPDKKLRCLVTTWDVPLRIDRAPDNDEHKHYQQFLQDERTHRLGLLDEAIKSFEMLAPGVDLSGRITVGSSKDPPGEALSADGTPTEDTQDEDAQDTTVASKKQQSELEKIQFKLDKALKEAHARLSTLSEEDEKQQGLRQLQQLATSIGGTNVVLRGLSQRLSENINPDPAVRNDFERLRGRTIAYLETRATLELMAPGIQRDVLQLMMFERTGGLLAAVKWLDEQLAVAKKNETGASFDSELSLVMWPDDYELLRWQPNYLRPAFDNSQLRNFYRTLMVARLDAPTLELAKGLVDTAIKVESEGLHGKVYIDNRGIGKLDQQNVSPGSYADFDRALLITAKGIEQQTDMEVVLETTPKLFQPGDCPEAALYCGWYSLANYVDAFDWVPGAVAYHLASSEATTLRKPESQVWCKRLLEEGVCATIGPVYEPYLVAFPRPNEFFGALLAGDLTLVECYYRTKPYNSWMMTLIGDPLYRPFASKSKP